MLEYVWATDPVELWSADDIREDSPEDAHRMTDETIGMLFHSGGRDGALVIGTARQVITRLEKAIALVVDEHRRVYGTDVPQEHEVLDGEVLPDPAGALAAPPPALPAAQPALPAPPATDRLTLGDPLDDDQVELLRDHAAADHAAGDSDWRGGAVYAYRITVLFLRADGAVLPPGIYLRHVLGGRAWAWPVLSGDVTAYLSDIEERFLAETSN